MKLLVRGLTAIAIVEDGTSVLLKDGEELIAFPEGVPLEEMDEGFVTALRLEGIDGALRYLNTPKWRPEISMWRFRKRFTFEQRVAIEAARSQNPVIETLMRDLESVKGQMVDLSLEDTQMGVGLLVQEGLITQSRADYVLFYGDGEMPVPDDTPPVEDPGTTGQ